jgi:hypothetical protein
MKHEMKQRAMRETTSENISPMQARHYERGDGILCFRESVSACPLASGYSSHAYIPLPPEADSPV